MVSIGSIFAPETKVFSVVAPVIKFFAFSLMLAFPALFWYVYTPKLDKVHHFLLKKRPVFISVTAIIEKILV